MRPYGMFWSKRTVRAPQLFLVVVAVLTMATNVLAQSTPVEPYVIFPHPNRDEKCNIYKREFEVVYDSFSPLDRHSELVRTALDEIHQMFAGQCWTQSMVNVFFQSHGRRFLRLGLDPKNLTIIEDAQTPVPDLDAILVTTDYRPKMFTPDPAKPLVEWGYVKEEKIFEDEGRALYIAKEPTHTTDYIIMVHKISLNKPVLDLTLDGNSFNGRRANGNGQPLGRLSDAERAYFQKHIYPALATDGRIRMPTLSSQYIVIKHYVQGFSSLFKGQISVDEKPVVATAHGPFIRKGEYMLKSYDGKSTALDIVKEQAKLVNMRKHGATTYAVEQAKKQTQFNADIAKGSAAAQAGGYVYKNPQYWASLPDQFFQNVFNGNTVFNSNSPRLRVTYYEFVKAYSKRCAKYVGPDAVGFQETRVSTLKNGYGNVISKTQRPEDHYKVPRKFEKMLTAFADADKNAGSSKGAVGLVGSLLNGSGMRDLADAAQQRKDLDITIERFFSMEKCDNATMYQMGENLLRLAEERPSVQAAGLRILNAAAETQSAEGMGAHETLLESCMGNRNYNSNSSLFCNCINDNVATLVSKAGLSRYLKDYEELERDVEIYYTYMTKKGTTPAGVDAAAKGPLYKAVTSCRQ